MNIPNRITVIRICLIPLMAAAFYLDKIIPGFNYAGIAAAAIFAAASITDFLDGYIARKYNLVTNIGKFLDPIADKVLVVTALLLTVESGLIAKPFGAVFSSLIIARELIISGFRQIAASEGVIISADKTGKIKAVFQDISMILFLGMKSLGSVIGASLMQVYELLSYAVFTAAVILTIVSGLLYVIKNKKVLGLK